MGLRAEKSHQFGRRPGAFQKLHKGDNFLIAIDRTPDDSRLHDRIVRIQHRLHLRRIDVEAGAIIISLVRPR